MLDREALRRQLIVDLDKVHSLTLRHAAGDTSVKAELKQQEGAISITLALMAGHRCPR